MSYALRDRLLNARPHIMRLRQKSDSGERFLTRADFEVLDVLAYHHNEKTGQCNPSHDTIAEKASRTARHVRRSLHTLEAFGLLTITHNGGRHRSNHYSIKMDEIEAFAARKTRTLRTGDADMPDAETRTLSTETRTLDAEKVSLMSAEQRRNKEIITEKYKAQAAPKFVDNPYAVEESDEELWASLDKNPAEEELSEAVIAQEEEGVEIISPTPREPTPDERAKGFARSLEKAFGNPAETDDGLTEGQRMEFATIADTFETITRTRRGTVNTLEARRLYRELRRRIPYAALADLLLRKRSSDEAAPLGLADQLRDIVSRLHDGSMTPLPDCPVSSERVTEEVMNRVEAIASADLSHAGPGDGVGGSV